MNIEREYLIVLDNKTEFLQLVIIKNGACKHILSLLTGKVYYEITGQFVPEWIAYRWLSPVGVPS